MSRKIIIVSILLAGLFLGGCVVTPGYGVSRNGVPIGYSGGGYNNYPPQGYHNNYNNPDRNSSAYEPRGYNPAKHPQPTYIHSESIRYNPVTGRNPYMERPMHQFPSTNQY
jgi:hypothetical protein